MLCRNGVATADSGKDVEGMGRRVVGSVTCAVGGAGNIRCCPIPTGTEAVEWHSPCGPSPAPNSAIRFFTPPSPFGGGQCSLVPFESARAPQTSGVPLCQCPVRVCAWGGAGGDSEESFISHPNGIVTIRSAGAVMVGLAYCGGALACLKKGFASAQRHCDSEVRAHSSWRRRGGGA